MKRNNDLYKLEFQGRTPDAGVIIMSAGLGCVVFVFALAMLVESFAYIAYAYILCHSATLICAALSGRMSPMRIAAIIALCLSIVAAVILSVELVLCLGVWMWLCLIPTMVLCIGVAAVLMRREK